MTTPAPAPGPVPAGSHARIRLPEGTERLDLDLRLLDHQIVGPEGELLGNVDDLELRPLDGRWHVTGLCVGPGALAERLPGLLGDWLGAVWRRLHPDPEPQPVVVPIEHVVRITSAVEVDAVAAEALADSFGLELWLRRHLVARLPGATGGADDRGTDHRALGRAQPGEPLRGAAPAAEGAEGWRPAEDGLLASSVLGRPAFGADGAPAGRVVELHGAARPHDAHQVPVELVAVQLGRRVLGARLGYSADPRQGPALVGRLVRRWQRSNRVVPVADVHGWGEERLVVDDPLGAEHPHAAW